MSSGLKFGAPVTFKAGSTTTTNTNPTTDNGAALGTASLRWSAAHLFSDILYGSTSGAITHQAANTTTSYTVKWPAAQGGASQVLTNDGSGNLSWAAAGGGGGANTALSNLAAVAINTGLLPASDGTISLGSGSLRWASLFASSLGVSTTAAPDVKIQVNTPANHPGANLTSNLLELNSTSGFAYMTLGNGNSANAHAYIGAASQILVFGRVADAGTLTEVLRIDNALLAGVDNTYAIGSASFRWTASHVVSGLLYGSTSGAITQQAANTTTSYTVKWPSAQGGSSTVLTNDGSGNLSWGAGGGANTALSNLASVAINTALLPGTDNSIANGSATKRWTTSHVLSTTIYGSTSGNIVVAAANTTTSYSVKWPSTQGGASTVLQNDGSGNLSWASVAGAGVISSSRITAYQDGANRSWWATASTTGARHSVDTSQITDGISTPNYAIFRPYLSSGYSGGQVNTIDFPDTFGGTKTVAYQDYVATVATRPFNFTTTYGGIFEDWVSGSTAGTFNWATAVSGTGAAITMDASVSIAQHPGVIALSTGTDTTGRAAIFTSFKSLLADQTSSYTHHVEVMLYIPTLSDGTNTFRIYAGIGDNSGAGNNTNGLVITYSSADGTTWFERASNNGSQASNNMTGSAVAAGTWYTLTIDVGSLMQTSVSPGGANISGGSGTTPTATIGREMGLLIKIEKTAGTTARTVLVDWVKWNKASTRA